MAKTIIAIILLTLSFSADSCIAILEGERDSGMHKICYYDHLGSTVAMTMDIYELCPQTWYVPH